MPAPKLTNDIINVDFIISNNDFYPRILYVTSGCVRTGLDSPDMKVIIRDGFLEKLIYLCQDMGRSGLKTRVI